MSLGSSEANGLLCQSTNTSWFFEVSFVKHCTRHSSSQVNSLLSWWFCLHGVKRFGSEAANVPLAVSLLIKASLRCQNFWRRANKTTSYAGYQIKLKIFYELNTCLKKNMWNLLATLQTCWSSSINAYCINDLQPSKWNL